MKIKKTMALLLFGSMFFNAYSLNIESSPIIVENLNQDNNYYVFKNGENIFSRLNQKVCFEVSIAKNPMNHQIRSSPALNGEQEKYEILDPSEIYKGGQFAAYYYPSKVKWPATRSAKLRVYGTMRSMSQTTRGGEYITYFLMLDKVEEISSEGEYYYVKNGESIFSRMDEKVCFEATFSKEIYQHMMRMSPPFQKEKEEHHYIDPASKYKGGQIVAYYFPSKVKWPANKSAKFLVYGTMSSMTGPGKGGGEHTEYYLILDKVVELK
jgi:hypothetical protein